MSNQETDLLDALPNAAFAYAPIEKSMTENQMMLQGRLRFAFISGATWQRRQILPDFKFILQALPNEHRITDLQLRAEIDLVRSKLNEIISKIQ